MKTAHRLANIVRVTEKGSPERMELLEALSREHHESARHYDGMEVRTRGEHQGVNSYCTYKVDVTAFEDDSMLLRLHRGDGSPPRVHPFDLDDPDDALRAAALLEETQLGLTMMAYLARAVERNGDWRIEDVDWLRDEE